jgi:hypothetical protein
MVRATATVLVLPMTRQAASSREVRPSNIPVRPSRTLLNRLAARKLPLPFRAKLWYTPRS